MKLFTGNHTAVSEEVHRPGNLSLRPERPVRGALATRPLRSSGIRGTQGDNKPVMVSVSVANSRTRLRSLAMTRQHNRAGFTLIEIVIAIAIISIALVTLLTAMNRTVATAAESSDITKSVLLAQEKLTMLNPEYGESATYLVSTDWLEDKRYPTLTYKVDIEETEFAGASQVTVQIRSGENNIFTLESYLIRK